MNTIIQRQWGGAQITTLLLTSSSLSSISPNNNIRPTTTTTTTTLVVSPIIITINNNNNNNNIRRYCSRVVATWSGERHAAVSNSNRRMEKQQFEEFRESLQESGALRERVRNVAAEIESTTRLIHSSLLLVHTTSLPLLHEVLGKAKLQIDVLRELFHQLAEIVHECPGQYYRYHGDWKNETQGVVSVLAYMHWLETGSLLSHIDAQEKLGLNNSEFGLDIEDYLVGICFMSNELPRFVVNQVTAGNYECPKKVLEFLTDLHASFRLLNLRNDFLRKKFDGMKYDLRKVEEVHYDVKIRGLAVKEDPGEKQAS